MSSDDQAEAYCTKNGKSGTISNQKEEITEGLHKVLILVLGNFASTLFKLQLTNLPSTHRIGGNRKHS